MRIHVLSRSAIAPVRYSRYVRTFLHHSCHTDDAFEAKVRHTAQATGSQVVLASSVPGTKFLIRRGDNVPNVRLMELPNLQSFEAAKDKWEFYRAAQSCAANTPRTWLARDRGWDRELSFPLLLKPRLGEGGAGILCVKNRPELLRFEGSPLVNSGDYILQEFIHGRDIGCSVFCRKGRVLAWTLQEAVRPGKREFQPPLDVRFGVHDDVLAQASRIIEYLDWTGVANFDMRIRDSDGKTFLLEMNPRFWSSIYGSLLAGVDFVGLNCSLVQPQSGRPQAGRESNYYQGCRAIGAWLKRHPTDFGSRLVDPVPDIVRKVSSIRGSHYALSLCARASTGFVRVGTCGSVCAFQHRSRKCPCEENAPATG